MAILECGLAAVGFMAKGLTVVFVIYSAFFLRDDVIDIGGSGWFLVDIVWVSILGAFL